MSGRRRTLFIVLLLSGVFVGSATASLETAEQAMRAAVRGEPEGP